MNGFENTEGLVEEESAPIKRQSSQILGYRYLSNSQKLDSTENIYLESSATKNEIHDEIEKIFSEAAENDVSRRNTLINEVFDISPYLTDAAAAIIDDSFLCCFTSATPDNWNWNLYLFPMWCAGVFIRHFILFPIRMFLLMFGFLIFFIAFFSVRATLKDSKIRRSIERALVRFQCGMFVVSWTGVIKFHGPRPVQAKNRVWVANHTSMIDFIILSSYSPFAAIMQLHPGWVGFIQKSVLGCLGCLWFNRTEAGDRTLVREQMKKHVSSEENFPLLIFPEGTCVNNEYCVMFKKGAFELGATVCPIAIKYNKIFVDAFWNSRRESFTRHLLKLMTSWALVCDVYFLQPQTIQPGEDAAHFASRVQELIAQWARLRIVPWDGYLKYYNFGNKNPHLIERRRKALADSLRDHLKNTKSINNSN